MTVNESSARNMQAAYGIDLVSHHPLRTPRFEAQFDAAKTIYVHHGKGQSKYHSTYLFFSTIVTKRTTGTKKKMTIAAAVCREYKDLHSNEPCEEDFTLTLASSLLSRTTVLYDT